MSSSFSDVDLSNLYLSTRPGPAHGWKSSRGGANSLNIALREADHATLSWLGPAVRQFWIWAAILILCALIYGVINRFIVTSVIVQGRSMVPTLQDGERYLLDRWTYHDRKPQRGDVVVLRDPGHSDLAIKRIVGMPGDTLLFKGGDVLLNGKRLIEAYLPSGTHTYTPNQQQLVLLGAGQYFVLGDNRLLSEDSRYYGPIQRHRIIGCLAH
jgi:signal peptidase I